MKRKWIGLVVAVVLGLAISGPAAAEIGYRGWGPRVGFSGDPDQIVGGVHFDLGEFAPHVRWQPSVDFGFGDDVFALTGNLMVAYYFQVQGTVTPYAGGQLTAAYFSFDDGRGGDDSDTEIGPAGVGGIETKLKSGTRFLAELQLGFGDIPDVKVLVGWTFK